jgi:hypothetical protein
MDKMKYLLLSSVLVLGSCATNEKIEIDPVNQEIVKNSLKAQDDALLTSRTTTAEIKERSTSIQSNTDTAKENLKDVEIPLEVREENDTLFQSIIDDSRYIATSADKLEREFQLIENQHEIMENLGASLDIKNARIDYLEGENEHLRNQALKAIYDYLVWVFVIGFLVVIGGAAVAFFVGRKLGISILAIGVVTLGFGAAATFYLKWIAITGFVLIGIGVLTTIGLLIYGVFEDRKKKKKLAQATIDNVKLVEAVKENIPDDLRTKFFGEGSIPGVAQSIQTEDTQKIVAKVRNKEFVDSSILT